MASLSEVRRYRTGMAKLLAKLVGAVGETESWLGVAVEGDEVSTRGVLEDDPAGAFRIMCALLLHKARIHMLAMLRANETSNVHSLAVQMRPVDDAAERLAALTNRKREILKLFAQGLSYQEIGEIRTNSALTVRNAVSGVQRKLGFSTRQQMVVWAVRAGLVDGGLS